MVIFVISLSYCPAQKALVISTAGHPLEHLQEIGCYQAMKTTMLVDRIFERAESKEFILLGSSEQLQGNAWQ